MYINQKKIEQETGLTYDKATKIAQGQVNGYSVAVTDSYETNQNYWNILFAVNDTSTVDWDAVENGHKRVYSIKVYNHAVHVVGKMMFKPYKDLADTLNHVAQALAEHGLTSVCSTCGSATEVTAVGDKGSLPLLLCGTCASDPAIAAPKKNTAGQAIGKMFLGKLRGNI